MTDSLDQRVERAMAELKATEEAVARTERELREASFDAVSSDRAVRVTVGPQGELSNLEFLEGKYRGMTSQQLAASVLEASQEARTRMGRHVMQAMAPFAGTSEGMPELSGLDVDWGKLFGPEVLSDPRDEPGRKNGASWRDALGEDGEE
ncbi:YbaB/EbfC family nucleoid-associated protein [Streptomyces sp. V2I9]|uniref:YbaB/EbfC family nucleoid-associated protein n=1 Tax=Streptomyces sp. V2I9 TaxID=3042304 RepID=UPI00277F507D|nr:YbaB/EbfC family nucleoid-associated protein [Streptomyces sp. V2I9]MDQ0988456.1 DNA-binding protein YbaB [Streptomyces sp. V2I9]